MSLVKDQNTPGICPRHGGTWGDDGTCSNCTDLDGNPIPEENEHVEDASNILDAFRTEEDHNRFRSEDYENEHRDRILDALVFALDHGWDPTK